MTLVIDVETDEDEFRADAFRESCILEAVSKVNELMLSVHEAEAFVNVYVVYVVDGNPPLYLGTFEKIRALDDLKADLRAWFDSKRVKPGLHFDLTYAPKLAPRRRTGFIRRKRRGEPDRRKP